jgi:glycosyltransferase involved in cell wall biosynthesis
MSPPSTAAVSILCIVKNGAQTIRRCIESVLAQDLPDLEFIIQDGASTDGTLDIIQAYKDPRIKLSSEVDSCGEEGFFRALRRATGDYVGICLADEQLLPHAARWAVAGMRANPSAGAIYGDLYLTDAQGNITCSVRQLDFDFKQFLCRRLYPHLCTTFIRKQALIAIGLCDREWALDCGDTELLLRLGLGYPIIHVPGIISKYAYHPGEMSMGPGFIHNLMMGTLRLMHAFFALPSLPGDLKTLEKRAFGNLYLNVASQYMTSDSMRKTTQSFPQIVDLFDKAFRFHPDADYAQGVGKSLLEYGEQLIRAKKYTEAITCIELLGKNNLPTNTSKYFQLMWKQVHSGYFSVESFKSHPAELRPT